MDTFLRPNAKIQAHRLIKEIPEKPVVTHIYSSKKLSQTATEIRFDAVYCKYFKRQLLAPEKCSIDLKLYQNQHEKCMRTMMKSLRSEKMPFLKYLGKLVLTDTFSQFSPTKLFAADIICEARNLVKIMMVHGDPKQGFSLYCTKYKGNIYLNEMRKPKQPTNKIQFVARHALFADNPTTEVNTDDPHVAKFHCVYNWKVCDSNLMYFTSVHGVDSDSEIDSETDLSTIKIVTVKSKFTETAVHFAHLSPFWWCTSLLYGSDEIHVVNVSDEHVIESINPIGLNDFLQGIENKWRKSSRERLSFLNVMLDRIKYQMTFVDCPYTVYEIGFSPKTQTSVHYKVHVGRNELSFLTDEYINAVNSIHYTSN